MASLTVGVCRERGPGDRLVAVLPASVRELRALGANVGVERGAGQGLGIADEAYLSAGADVVPREEILTGTDIVVALRPPGPVAGSGFRRGQVLVTLVTRLGSPLSAPFTARTWCDAGLTVFGPDLVPETEAGRPLGLSTSRPLWRNWRATRPHCSPPTSWIGRFPQGAHPPSPQGPHARWSSAADMARAGPNEFCAPSGPRCALRTAPRRV